MEDKKIVLEIPEKEAPQLAKALEEAVHYLRQLNEEDEARQSRIAAISAETDALLQEISKNLAYVEEHLRSPLPDFYSR
jgi:uncharacterized FlaG/YvyC family protein